MINDIRTIITAKSFPNTITDSKFGTTDIRAIAFGNGKFVAAGNNGKMAYWAD